jgi:predicted dehydrogenase
MQSPAAARAGARQPRPPFWRTDIVKTVNIGIIGTGGIANNAHLPAYAKCPNAKIVALCDIKEDALNATGDKYDVPKENRYLDFNEMLARDDIDAVSVCTPNDVHRDAAVAALRAGKHALVEKPLARTGDEAQEIVNAARETGMKCMTAFVSRYGAEAKTLKRFIDAGELGDIYYARAQYLRRRGIPGWGVFGQKDKQGGGPLIDIGVHALDLVLWLMGHPKPVSVTAISVCKFGKNEECVGLFGQWDRSTFTVEDFGAGFIRFDDGRALLLEASWALNIKPEAIHQISLMGDKGGADIQPLTIYTERNGSLLDVTPIVQKNEPFTEEIAGFVNAVANDTPVPIPCEDGLLASRILDAIYLSAETGRVVDLA